MEFRCSQCHTVFSAEGDEPGACPNCKAEAGLEPVKGIPVAMKLFGTLLSAVLVATVAGTLYTVSGG